MSHRPGGHHHHRSETAAHAQTAQRPKHGRGRHADDFMLAHAGRQVRLGPVAFWIAVGSLVVMGVWSIATATYFAFHDDVLTRLLTRQAEMQSAYEDRITDLRAQVDHITSRQLLDQEQFEQKLEQVQRRQSALEQRNSLLNGLGDPTTTGSIRSGGRGARMNAPAVGAPPKASPISDTVIFVAPPDREARLESRVRAGANRIAENIKSTGVEGVLGRLQASLDRVEARQDAALNEAEESYDSKAQRMRGVLAELGIAVDKGPAASSGAPMGGPFVPVKLRGDSSVFERQLYRVSLARAQVDRLTRTLANVPVRKPILGEIDTTSTFGMRIDPFVHTLAMHTGLDFRGNIGDPVRATAAGTVTIAGWTGGYGKMIEIAHGNGLATRYGHLSAIDVQVGQKISIGQTIGRLGSTGRSTGPHLHYETRVDGEPVDPQRFLRAGIRLGGMS